jgi:hypothetical protein
MAWIDQVNDDISIQTGDGKIYNPLYVLSPMTTDYNVAEFNFPNIKGTLVDKREPMGRKFTLEMIFQGDDQLETIEEFRKSADVKKYWQIAHPVYGTIFCQPSSLEYDSTGYNTTRVKGNFIETIINDAPRTTIDPKQKVENDVDTLNQRSVPRFENTEYSPKNVSQMKQSTAKIYEKGSKSVKSGLQANEYFNLFNKANAAITEATVQPVIAISQIKSMIMYPYQFSESVKFRVNLFKDQIISLIDLIGGLTDKESKMNFENDTTTLMLGMVKSSVNPLDSNDYKNMNDVLLIIDSLATTYNLVVQSLDSIQSETGADENSYIPDYENLIGLDSIVNYAMSTLMQVALNADQERIFVCDSDTNVILLSHKLYGSTEKTEELINNNNIGLNELLQIKKGRVIKYYV